MRYLVALLLWRRIAILQVTHRFDSSACPILIIPAAERTAAARAILEGSDDASADAVSALEKRRAELQAERLQVKKALRNENRKRKRLLAKAKGLSDEDLMNVVIMKAAAKAKAKAKTSPG